LVNWGKYLKLRGKWNLTKMFADRRQKKQKNIQVTTSSSSNKIIEILTFSSKFSKILKPNKKCTKSKKDFYIFSKPRGIKFNQNFCSFNRTKKWKRKFVWIKKIDDGNCGGIILVFSYIFIYWRKWREIQILFLFVSYSGINYRGY
jgi:hypothetical protein